MLYRVVIRNGVWVRTLPAGVLPTDKIIQGTYVPNLLQRSASLGQVRIGEIGKCVGFHQHRCVYNRASEATSSPHQYHTVDEKLQIES